MLYYSLFPWLPVPPPAIVQVSPDLCCYSQTHHPRAYWNDLPITIEDILDGNSTSCVSAFEFDRSVLHSAIAFYQRHENFLISIQGYNLSCQERNLLVYFDAQRPNLIVMTHQCVLDTVFSEVSTRRSECGFICNLVGVCRIPVVVHVVLQTHLWDPPVLKGAQLCEVHFHAVWLWNCDFSGT